eukprot:4197647-Amphidinium_carterae.1
MSDLAPNVYKCYDNALNPCNIPVHHYIATSALTIMIVSVRLPQDVGCATLNAECCLSLDSSITLKTHFLPTNCIDAHSDTQRARATHSVVPAWPNPHGGPFCPAANLLQCQTQSSAVKLIARKD